MKRETGGGKEDKCRKTQDKGKSEAGRGGKGDCGEEEKGGGNKGDKAEMRIEVKEVIKRKRELEEIR